MRHSPIALLISAALTVCGVGAQTAPVTEHITSRLTANGLKASVSFLASDALEGRGTPSRGLDVAAEFVASQFRRAGLEPAGDDGYFQTAAYASVTPVVDGLDVTFETSGQSIKADKASMSVGAAAAVSMMRAAVVRLTPADTPTEDVRGKIVLFDPGNLPGGRGGAAPLMRRIQSMQPALVITLAATGRNVPPTAQIREASAAVVPSLTVWDPAVRTALAGAADVVVSVQMPAPKTEPMKLRNIIGVLRGSDPVLKETYVLVTAHYDHLGIRGSGEGDHIFNGANDDASGTASVMEIAQTLATLPERPKRSIVFLTFFGEELGLVGSRYYAAHPVFPLAKTVADVNLEQMGRTDDTTGPRESMFNVTGYDYTSLTAEFRKAGEELGIQVVKDEKNSDPFYAASDNQAFADAGVPSHTLSVAYVFPDYHRAGDEWPKLDYENMAKVDRVVALSVWRVAENPEAPAWNGENPKTERYRNARQAQ